MRDCLAHGYSIPGGASQKRVKSDSGEWCRTLSDLDWGQISVMSHRDGFRQPYSNFSNRPHPLAQNRGTILMGIVLWRVTENPKIAILGFGQNLTSKKKKVMISTSGPAAEIAEVTDGCAVKS